MSRFPFQEIAKEAPEPVAVQPRRLRDVKPSELLVRFAFGAAIALVAGLVGMRFGPRLGGLFLAFPAVLPASLTLLERKDGREKADVDALGAILGSIGMVGFAVAAFFALPRFGGVAALVAWGGWAVVAVGLFFVVRRMLSRHAVRRRARSRVAD